MGIEQRVQLHMRTRGISREEAAWELYGAGRLDPDELDVVLARGERERQASTTNEDATAEQ